MTYDNFSGGGVFWALDRQIQQPVVPQLGCNPYNSGEIYSIQWILELQQVGGWEMMGFFFYFNAAKKHISFGKVCHVKRDILEKELTKSF